MTQLKLSGNVSRQKFFFNSLLLTCIQEIVTILYANVAAAKELGTHLEAFTVTMSRMGDEANQTHEALLKVQEEVSNLPGLSSLFLGIGNALVGDIFGSEEVLVFVVIGSSSFASLDTWGPFRTRATTVMSLAIGFGKPNSIYSCETY